MSDPRQHRNAKLEPRTLPVVACPECGAENYAFAPRCWICQCKFDPNDLIQGEKTVESPAFARPHSPLAANLPVLILLPALIVIGYGVAWLNPYLFIPYLLLISLPMLGISFLIRSSWTQPGRKPLLGGSIAVSVILFLMAILGSAIFVIAAIVILVFLICTNQIDRTNLPW
ncbi:hypothetical protein LOC68_26870 [Blastopirellula sp. JC732]|uniref:Uncharacterized protein n=1 Tax=Blastopirellula sediminis TaxID=2894196 RepID=A0A9X1MTY8_9BACT|nr:hypothetical protein [Blastopirellula sediminis]MCC9604670.1 hypothetical protein [Blastopirellula sediminis]MCC9632032.1 hypothetical protein [Blastopirellula sediminis]